jgi:hypothetical protein
MNLLDLSETILRERKRCGLNVLDFYISLNGQAIEAYSLTRRNNI